MLQRQSCLFEHFLAEPNGQQNKCRSTWLSQAIEGTCAEVPYSCSHHWLPQFWCDDIFGSAISSINPFPPSPKNASVPRISPLLVLLLGVPPCFVRQRTVTHRLALKRGTGNEACLPVDV